MRILLSCALLRGRSVGAAQKYTGPLPPQPDIPYLKHAENLVPTEVLEAKEEKGKKDDITYVVAGATSARRTPLASPIFLLQAERWWPRSWRSTSWNRRNGRREITFSPKKQPKAIRVELTRLNTDKLFRLEVEESLEPGEYALSAGGFEHGVSASRCFEPARIDELRAVTLGHFGTCAGCILKFARRASTHGYSACGILVDVPKRD